MHTRVSVFSYDRAIPASMLVNAVSLATVCIHVFVCFRRRVSDRALQLLWRFYVWDSVMQMETIIPTMLTHGMIELS